MKRVATTFGIVACLLVGAFYVSDVHAQTIYQSTYNPSEEDCWHMQNGADPNCNDSGTGNDSYEVRIDQELVIQQDSSDPQITFSSIEIFYHSCARNGTDWTGTAYLLDDNDYSNYVANSHNVTSARATSTATSMNCANGSDEFTFITPYVKDSNNDLTWFVIETSVPPSGTYMFPRILRTYGTYPTYGFGDVFGGYRGYDSSYGTIQTNYDWQFNLYRNDTVVSFTYPENNTQVNDDPLNITGTCNDSVELYVYDGVSYASSTNAYGATVSCSSNTFSYPITLEQGFWSAFASSTNSTAGIVFYYAAQTFIPVDTDLFTPNPFQSEEGGNESEWFFLRDWAENLITLRPYSYIPTVLTRFNSAMNNPSSTDWLADFTFDAQGTLVTISGITSTTLSQIDSQYSSDMRSFSTIIEYVAFIVYIIHYVRRWL